MREQDHGRSDGYREVLSKIFGRRLLARDALRETRIERAEKRLGFTLFPALRDYYLLAGQAKENRQHNRLFCPEELVVDGRYLRFMEENQAVVHWGVRMPLGRVANPNVWQRVNEDSARWYSEKMPFSIFIVKNLAWQRGVKLSRQDLQLTSGAWGGIGAPIAAKLPWTQAKRLPRR